MAEVAHNDSETRAPRTIRDQVSIVLCGEAGQGLQTIEQLLTHTLKLAGFNVFATTEFMSRIRGGCNSTEIRVSRARVRAYVDQIDILIPLSSNALEHLGARVSDDTVVLAARHAFPDVKNLCDVDFEKLAAETGGKLYANTVAVGVIFGILGADPATLEGGIKQRFESKGEKILNGNVAAAKKGYDVGRTITDSGALQVDIAAVESAATELLLNGATAVGLGGLAGGCDFVSSYPMSPSTGVLVFYAQHAHAFGTVVEQAEDEIAAINMCLGAWYAGGRAMVTTSGGGFALMCEGMSLAGMTESPLVVHLAQRPGPATGLPTRTEQGDLNLALYAGHGEYPRILLAPGSLEDAFELTRRAFDLADRYQVPVIILTDQFLMDSYWNIPSLDLDHDSVQKYFRKTGADYRRYDLSGDNVSPRGIPGYGDGLVCLDSDEHDEAGHITENLALRTRMVDKRMAKLASMADEPWCCETVGPADAALLVICWGSTYHAVQEALERLGNDRIACMHLKRVYPLPSAVGEAVAKAKRVAVVENNACGQLADLIRRETGFNAHHRVRKYNGLPFSVEELTATIGEVAP